METVNEEPVFPNIMRGEKIIFKIAVLVYYIISFILTHFLKIFSAECGFHVLFLSES